ncbi:MAG: hypothetical protein H7196_04315 [candidate division SR1 bacterium]|nr:hypothetical protein [candidate division SR1 bacterium]
MILPSLLEYSIEALKAKLKIIIKNRKLIRTLQGQDDLNLHLDFVLPQFAKDRSIMTSLGLSTTFKTIEQIYKNQNLYLSVHLMGEIEDLFSAYTYFENLKINPYWNYLILVPEKYLNSWKKLGKKLGKNIIVGCWYDLNEWPEKFFTQKRMNLLMTVVAGKSGQKLQKSTRDEALKMSEKYPNSHFILDGGWKTDAKCGYNTDIVSYTDFWKNIDK